MSSCVQESDSYLHPYSCSIVPQVLPEVILRCVQDYRKLERAGTHRRQEEHLGESYQRQTYYQALVPTTYYVFYSCTGSGDGKFDSLSSMYCTCLSLLLSTRLLDIGNILVDMLSTNRKSWIVHRLSSSLVISKLNFWKLSCISFPILVTTGLLNVELTIYTFQLPIYWLLTVDRSSIFTTFNLCGSYAN